MRQVEQDHYNEVLGIVQQVMREKLWYTYHPDGSYDWPGSVHAITEDLKDRLRWDAPDLETHLRLTMENSFSADGLTLIDREHPIPFVQSMALLGRDNHAPVYMWTVGDTVWQRTKFEKSGANRWIDDAHFRAVPRNKHEELANIIQELKIVKTAEQAFHVYVVDDKWSNLNQLSQLKAQVASAGIFIHDYHLKPLDSEADPTACYRFIKKEIEKHTEKGEQSAIILDFDGVCIDSDGTLFHGASVDIAHFFFNHL